MEFDTAIWGHLGVAFNEAGLLSFEVDQEYRNAAATFTVLSLPPEGPEPTDRRVQLCLWPVGRVVASLRKGAGDDLAAEVVPIAVEDLPSLVRSFGGLPVYGWQFFDTDEQPPLDRLSLDWRSGDDGLSHTVCLFQEDNSQRYLELWAWFDELGIRSPDGSWLPLDEFVAGGRRWWDAFYAHDPRTEGHGLFPLAPSEGRAYGRVDHFADDA
jgi:hypothetical protein